MLAEVAERPENEVVLAYLWTDQLPSWRESDSPWIVDGYSLSTHPDLCERIKALADAAGGRFGYLYGRPAVADDGGVIVAFGAGTHIFCLRLASEECEVAVTRRDEPAKHPLLREKQLELEALVAGGTRADPWAAAATDALAAALRRASS
jgi:hypothetical protein